MDTDMDTDKDRDMDTDTDKDMDKDTNKDTDMDKDTDPTWNLNTFASFPDGAIVAIAPNGLPVGTSRRKFQQHYKLVAPLRREL
jgi:hypothetical protein